MILQIAHLVAGYGRRQILADVSLDLAEGEVVGLIGHNGAGKSTLLRAVVGLAHIWAGEVSLGGVKEVFRDPYSARVKGVAYIPQGGRVFGALTVRENLLLGGSIIRSQGLLRERLANAYGRFAVLSSKRSMRAAALSGGERQMLALATGLMIAPRVLLVDEPTLGLAPKIARESLEQLREFAHAGGVSILVVEQKVREVLSTADRVYALKQGRIVFCSQGGSSFDYASLRDVYL